MLFLLLWFIITLILQSQDEIKMDPMYFLNTLFLPQGFHTTIVD